MWLLLVVLILVGAYIGIRTRRRKK
jgi:uncharacterized membrane protein YfcA